VDKQKLYTNIHEYLDDVLRNVPDPTHLQVKEAKRAYWKLYYRQYRSEKRKVRKEFTLGFDRDTMARIKQKKGSLDVSKFLYLIIETYLSSDKVPSFDKEILAGLHLKLMELIGHIEELLDNDGTTVPSDILERLETVERSFSQLIDTKQ